MKILIVTLILLSITGCPYKRTVNRPSNCDGNFEYYCDDTRCRMIQPSCRP